MKITDEMRAAIALEVEGATNDLLLHIAALDEIPTESVHMQITVEPEALRRFAAA